MQHVLALAQIEVGASTVETGTGTVNVDETTTTTTTSSSSSSAHGSGYSSSSYSSGSSTSTSTQSSSFDIDASRTTETSGSVSVDIDRFAQMYDPLHNHLTILEFSGSLDATLEALVTKIEIVGGHIDQRALDITRVRKDVDILIEDNNSLEADVLVIQNTHSDVTLKYERIHKQVTDIEGMWSGLRGAHGSVDARISSLEYKRTDA